MIDSQTITQTLFPPIISEKSATSKKSRGFLSRLSEFARGPLLRGSFHGPLLCGSLLRGPLFDDLVEAIPLS